AVRTKVIDTHVLQQRNWTHYMAHVYRLAISREEHSVIHLRFIFLAKVLAVLLKDCELSSVCRMILIAGSAVEFEDFLTAVVSKSHLPLQVDFDSLAHKVPPGAS